MTYPPQQQSPFSQPSSPGGGDTFTPGEHMGALLLVYPKNFVDGANTKHGATAQADVDVIVVDRPGPNGQPQSFIGARFFGNLAKSVRNDLGGQVLGRLGQGPNTQGSPPWILTDYTPQDAMAAGAVHAQYQQGLFKPTPQPSQQQAAGSPPPAYGNPPAQQWQAPPQQPPAAPAQQQWQQPPAAPQQQYQAPAPTPAPPVATPPAAAASPVDPALVQFLAGHGITLPPGATHQQALDVAANLPQ